AGRAHHQACLREPAGQAGGRYGCGGRPAGRGLPCPPRRVRCFDLILSAAPGGAANPFLRIKAVHGAAHIFSMVCARNVAHIHGTRLEVLPMSLQESVVTRLPYVLADMNYLGPMSERPRNYTFEPPAGAPWSNVVNETREMAIHD